LALTLWLLRFDIARITIHKIGLPRFAAACLFSGYAWLAVRGLLGATENGEPNYAQPQNPGLFQIYRCPAFIWIEWHRRQSHRLACQHWP